MPSDSEKMRDMRTFLKCAKNGYSHKTDMPSLCFQWLREMVYTQGEVT